MVTFMCGPNIRWRCKRLKLAIREAERKNLLGHAICGSNFDLNIQIRLGAGAFVCGEETALIESIEGRRGIPRPRPPYPAEKGLWGCPTLINNVETYANVPLIIAARPRMVCQLWARKKAKAPRSLPSPAKSSIPA